MPAAARSAWPLSVALIASLAACHAEPQRTAAPEPAPAAARVQPNVLLVIVDALRADRLGVNGAPPATTPVLDRLAAEGVNFGRAFAHSTWTKPSIATLLTSVYPSEHGLIEVGSETEQGLQTGVLGREFKTMAEAFWEGGYTTVGLVNQVHLRGKYGFDRGFERYKSVRGHGASALTCKFVDRLIAASDHRPFFG